jgi:peptide deformylase
MAIRKIELFGSKVLREKAKKVEKVNAGIKTLLDDMVDTMRNAKGAGLAANQVGVALRVMVIDLGALEGKEDIKYFINPEIVEASGKREAEEGCLSFPQIFVKAERPKRVKVKALDREGKPFEVEGEDFVSKALCHELDHLDGILMIDHVSALKREFVKKRIKKLIKEGEWENPYPRE